MKTQTVIIALATALFAVPVLTDHNRVDQYGRKQGHWTEFPGVDGFPKWEGLWERLLSAEGDYVNGKMHGHWVLRYAHESPAVDIFDGKVRLGPSAFGIVLEGPFVNGKQTGHWVVRYDDGSVSEGPVVNGKKHGKWVWRFADGKVWEGPMVGGKQHGRWVERYPSGSVNEGPYVNDKKHGKWVWRKSNGEVTESCWKNNELAKC
ncbi:MAG: hypothetical protein OXU22_06665 [Gammaproteobacteria bacterium]|nr:hypothetical protein [Gammaproteobacteria bacterium]